MPGTIILYFKMKQILIYNVMCCKGIREVSHWNMIICSIQKALIPVHCRYMRIYDLCAQPTSFLTLSRTKCYVTVYIIVGLYILYLSDWQPTSEWHLLDGYMLNDGLHFYRMPSSTLYLVLSWLGIATVMSVILRIWE